jgi:hypothetical protein
MCANIFTWWQTHNGQFPNFSFFAEHISWDRSQIETKRMFNLANVLTTLRCYYLQVENFDQIITIVKNWPNDPCLNDMTNQIPRIILELRLL